MGRLIFAITARETEVFRPHRNLTVGDLVLITDQHSPRGQWPMGIMEEVMVDRNRHVHQATVKTARCILTRDIRKLCLLEVASV